MTTLLQHGAIYIEAPTFIGALEAYKTHTRKWGSHGLKHDNIALNTVAAALYTPDGYARRPAPTDWITVLTDELD